MQPTSPKYNGENGDKQIKTTKKNLSQSCILCQLLRTKSLISGSKCIKHFFNYFYLLSGCVLFNMSCLALHFLKYPWWLLWIFCAPTPLNFKIKLPKQKIIRGLWKIVKNVSWPINICLKYLMKLKKPSDPTPPPFLSYILNVRFLSNLWVSLSKYDIISSFHFIFIISQLLC